MYGFLLVIQLIILLIITIAFFIIHIECKKMIYKPKIVKQETIDLNYNTYCSDLFSRKLWQVLYPAFVEYGDTDRLDSFLCDLKVFKNQFLKAVDDSTFYWAVGYGGHTCATTEIVKAKKYDCVYEIKFIPNFPNRKLNVTLIQEPVS